MTHLLQLVDKTMYVRLRPQSNPPSNHLITRRYPVKPHVSLNELQNGSLSFRHILSLNVLTNVRKPFFLIFYIPPGGVRFGLKGGVSVENGVG